ncbi:MAG: hypothetical protein AAGA77_11660 [Bacteroidota bacterium]
MKRLAILFVILISLGGVAYYLNSTADDGKTSWSATERDFSFPRDQIGKVTIQKVGDPMQTFTLKSGGTWYLDDIYKVSQFTMPYLLQCLGDITIHNIPSKNATENILRDMDRMGIQVQVYDLEGNKVRSYRVGLEAHDDVSTSYIMDGSNQPYNMYLKGFDGDVRSRFLHPIDQWRDREIWQYDPKEIVEVDVKYHKDLKESFKLTVQGSSYNVTPLSQFIEASEKEVDQDRARAYLSAFTRIYAEDYDNENIRRDSISALVPFVSISVKDKNGHVNAVDFFPFRDLLLRNVNTRDLEEAKKIERFFINHSKGDFMVVQKRQTKEVFRPYSFFLKD